MSELITQLQAAGQRHAGTDLGGLLQWASIHIESLEAELQAWRDEADDEQRERLKLEQGLHAGKILVEQALQTLRNAWCPPVELGRDLAPHINLMAAHGDPDYLRKNGQSIRHVDTRETKARKAQGAA